MIEHHFNIEDAKKYGVEKAILLYNMRFWLDKELANFNKGNKRVKINEYKGKKYVWTYNSAASFGELFPYLSERSISRWLTELEECNIIISCQFNKAKYDRTKWYTMSEYSISENVLLDSPKGVIMIAQNGEPIPDNKPDNKQHISSNSDLLQVIPLETTPDLPLTGSITSTLTPEDPTKVTNANITHLLAEFNKYNKGVGYKNRTNRDAIKTLLEDYTVDQIKEMIKDSFEILGKPMAPSITNPYELLVKLPKLKNYFK